MIKFLRRLSIVLVITSLILSVFCIASYAEGSESVDPPQDLPPEEGSTDTIVDVGDVPQHILQFVKTMDENKVTVTIKYTKDSAVDDGVFYEIGYDELKEQVYLMVSTAFGEGYSVYDKESTPYIDGLKINDAFVESDTYPYRYYLTDPTVSYTIVVKTVYSDSILGTLEKIQNGDASILDLFENPVLAMQVIYYAIAVVSLILSVILSRKVKSTKAKTSDEIAAAVATTNEAGKAELTAKITELILSTLSPMLASCVKSNQSVVKAVALSNSKAKDAPIALLDELATVSQSDILELIENLKNSVTEAINSENAERESTLNALTALSETSITDEPVEDSSTPSIF